MPEGWGNLTALRTVDVSDNRLTGTLPASWEGLANAEYLNFSANNLGGTIPANWRVSSNNNGTVDEGLINLEFM